MIYRLETTKMHLLEQNFEIAPKHNHRSKHFAAALPVL